MLSPEKIKLYGHFEQSLKFDWESGASDLSPAVAPGAAAATMLSDQDIDDLAQTIRTVQIALAQSTPLPADLEAGLLSKYGSS